MAPIREEDVRRMSYNTAQGLLLSINAGASSAWTVTQCIAKLKL